MGWAIICDARFGCSRGIALLALVDRSVRRDMWWTSDDTDAIMEFRKRAAAEFSRRKFHRNNPRVVPFKEAEDAIREQRTELERQGAEADSELGWDGHKG